MMPNLKIKCKKGQYRSDGTCAYIKLFEKNFCLRQNCVYYEGENKNV